ncbi:FKBP-type peptidyl-prolyl cis-trans isomerase [Candidatus Babeliales bacterium]|nr:FKBP-type peptidyl-prolyl cis-trans isomerase [Candidatus Babeliales bacterium]
MKKLLIFSLSIFVLISIFNSCTNKKSTKNLEVKTNTGLRFEILNEGDSFSSPPQQGQLITVHYEGWLDEDGEKGKMFDSSRKRGNPFQFRIGTGQVIKGWDEGVASMRIGEIRKLVVPAHLAYGSRGAGDSIPPHSTLIFEVELLNIS